MSLDPIIADSDGLHEIANTTERDLKADIVFVHGLGGVSHGTWRHGLSGKEGHFFWPEELGKDLPECGIWSVGYPAGFTALGKPGMIIDKRAGNLSHKLANAGLGERPLLFITHSMAGLIVKSLIVGSQTLADSDRKRLVKMIRGIVFCATPHRGSAFAEAAGVLGMFFGGSQAHVDEMRANAEPLDILHDQFIEWHRLHAVPVESYAENIGLYRTRWWSRPLPLGLVVPRASANPGIAGHTVRDVDDDHLTIVKPKDRRHDVYAGVLRFIREALSKDSSEAQHRAKPEQQAHPRGFQSEVRTTVGLKRPRVYLSYTKRTAGFKEAVFELAERLRESGIDSRIDRYYEESRHGFTPPDAIPGQDSWKVWQEEQIRKADYVLLVCSQEYITGGKDSGVWRDVELMRRNRDTEGAPPRKFIPVGFGAYEVTSAFVPSFIKGAHYYDLTPGGTGFESLVRRFQTEYAAEEGGVDNLSRKSERGLPLTENASDAQTDFAWYNRGLRALADQKHDEALESFSQAILLNPTLTVAFYNRGFTHLQTRNEELAITDFDRAWDLGFREALLFRGRGQAFARQGDVERALSDYTQAIALEPGDAVAYLNRGEVYQNTMQKELATADYQKVLTLHCNPRWHDVARKRLLEIGVKPSAPESSSALVVWEKKLAFLQIEEARASDAAQKFSITEQINEARAKIEELRR